VIGEEWGLAGTVGTLLLYLVIAYRGTRIVQDVQDSFGKLLATGITGWIILQALMNYAVITSSVPFTGVPLPFVSYGGSSLVISMVAIGILLNVSRFARGETARGRQDHDHGRGNRRARVPRVIDHPVPERDRKPGRAGTRRPALQ
jgi:cell division protein FtsW